MREYISPWMIIGITVGIIVACPLANYLVSITGSFIHL